MFCTTSSRRCEGGHGRCALAVEDPPALELVYCLLPLIQGSFGVWGNGYEVAALLIAALLTTVLIAIIFMAALDAVERQGQFFENSTRATYQ